MNIADRIQQLRKSKGISQEELANSIGVSRQAVSKWESAQSVPDVEKIILLSDYFETTTDFLLKGIAPALVPEKRYSAMMFALIGTVLNAIGLVSSIVIWIEQQRAYAVGLGFAVMLIGTGIFLMGQFLDTRDKQKAKRFFLLPGVWILLFVPMAFCFNTLMGLKGGGFSWWIAPVPMPMHSYKTFGLYWIIYIAVCTAIDILIARQNRSAP
mgnify:FL=1